MTPSFVGEDSFEGAPIGRQATWLRGVGTLLGFVIDIHWGGLLDLKSVPAFAEFAGIAMRFANLTSC